MLVARANTVRKPAMGFVMKILLGRSSAASMELCGQQKADPEITFL
jgi:hypothetical protein